MAGETTVLLEDSLLPDNSGAWRLTVSGGRGALTPAEATDAALHLGANGFAALFAGTPVHVLRTAGLACGGEVGAEDLLDAAFAGGPAYLLEYF